MRSSPVTRLVFWLVTGLVALAAVACTDGSDDSASGATEVRGRGDVAPTFDGPLLSGDRLSMASLEGRPVIVNFWTTTCIPCIREMPALAAVAREHEADGLVVIGVNYGEQEVRVQTFVDELEGEIDYPIVLDHDGSVGRLYGVVALPMTYFIDGEGVIQYRRIGELKEAHLAEGLNRTI